MSEALLAPLAAWQTYYVIVGTAAATLTGLMFVAITLMAQLRVRLSSSWSHMRVFNTSTMVHFGTALLSAPWPALWTAALLLGLAGLGLLGVGFLERAHRVRRGEGGWEGRGGPLWSPAVPFCDVHPPCRQPYRATRATIKAHSTHPHRPRPYGSGSFAGGSPQKNLPVKAGLGG